MDRLKQFMTRERKSVNLTTIKQAYDDFLYKESDRLEEEFHAKNDFTTTMRGVKVRGVYSTAKEAEMRGKKLQQKDKYFNIFIGEVGKWLPWDPEPHKVQEQEYAEEQLNTIMKKYKDNEDNKERFFDERRKEEVGAATAASRAGKRVFGAEGGQTEITTTELANNLFETVGDLALARKQAAASAGQAVAVSSENTVVTGSATE
jgi:hypothetical protein